ncbi:hypothetical protein [Gulosibacter chungangensis]|nr:hypothetical protein [Gulosibacter chungangensis]
MSQGLLSVQQTPKQWRGLTTRYNKHAVAYRTTVPTRTTIVWTQGLSDPS